MVPRQTLIGALCYQSLPMTASVEWPPLLRRRYVLATGGSMQQKECI